MSLTFDGSSSRIFGRRGTSALAARRPGHTTQQMEAGLNQLKLSRHELGGKGWGVGVCFAFLAVCLLMLAVSPSRADAYSEEKFCWGETLGSKNGGGPQSWCMASHYWGELNALYGTGEQHSVCVRGSTSGVTGCSGGAGQGIYLSLPGIASGAVISNNGFSNNKVYGTAFYTVAPPPPPPSWHTENLGGTLTSDPDICSWGKGSHYEIFARGTDNALWHKYWTESTGWSGWESLGGSLASGPGCVSWGPNRVDVVARASNNTVLHWYWNGASWQSDNLGGSITYDPDIASTASERLDVFGRASDGSIAHRWWNGTSWNSWVNRGGANAIVTGVGAVGSEGNRVDVVGRAPNNSVFHLYYAGGWYTENFGGLTQSDPDMSSWGSGVFDVWMRGTDNGLWHKWWTGSSWTDWESTGLGSMASSPGADSPRPGRHDIVTLNSSGNLIHHYWE
jgi:hypothetical protein